MSIMDRLFGSGAAKPQTAMPTGVANNPTVPNPAAPGSDGTMVAIPPKAQGTESPFDAYKDLWKPPAQGEQVGIPNALPDFALDPAKLKSFADGVDFTSGIPTETLMSALKGDEKALRGIFNEVGRRGLQENFTVGLKTVEGAMKRQTDNLTSKTIPELLRRQNISELNRSSSDLFANPAIAPVLTMLENQFANKFPSATPEQIRDHTANYWKETMSAYAGATGKQLVDVPKQEAGGQNTDWDRWVA